MKFTTREPRKSKQTGDPSPHEIEEGKGQATILPGKLKTKKLDIRKDDKKLKEEQVLTREERDWKHKDEIMHRIEDNKRILEELIGLGTSFDIVFREMKFAGKKAALLFFNGFANDIVMSDVLTRLTYVQPDHLSDQPLDTYLHALIPHVQVEKVHTMSGAIQKMMLGSSILFLENESAAIVIDAKQFPVRSIEEPSLEKVVRGSRDGFVETMLMNISLVRRRLKDPNLKFELLTVGKRTRTDISVGYVSDIADMDLVEAVKDKIQKIKVEGLPLADKQLEEEMMGRTWNPYPMVRYSERPDVIAAHLLEGHVIVFVDTSPSAMILPTTFFHHVQHAEEHRQTPMIGTYFKWVRFIGIMASIFLLPLWYLMVAYPAMKPEALAFIGPQETANLPIIIQFLIAEVGIDMLRMAAVHTPTPLVTAMGLVAAIVIGEFAVSTGLFVNEVVLYMAVAAIGMFATPSYELSVANRIVRLLLLVSVFFFKIPGLVIGTTLVMLILIFQRSYNSPYMWPFIPFNANALFSIVIRKPFRMEKVRPSITKSLDNTRRDP
ncbi:spore germination protein [Marinicrinis sediminis]|uniref:Spore germination protein n=1 Tax=Marinicrinis sediminis TaxID=1652465 RepID=A0ABW5REM2_9BACL